ncbi:MAG: hypothetical protein H7138_24775 [Myxococcales bacterium]|nr:hypothetical protein [Myxococcales bacterium]
MRWIVSLSVVAAVALIGCGGTQIPTHNGYKPKEAKPWKKPKTIKLNDKSEGKVDGDVSYGEMRRAKWYQVELPANGQLSLQLEITPPGDAVNDDFDLAMEVLDPSLRVISKSDIEEEDAHELNKKKTLVDLPPGKYLIHLYLQGRTDSADFTLRTAFKSTAAAEAKTNFPAEVLYVPPLPLVLLQDDTPRDYKAQTTTVVRTPRRTPAKEPKVEAPVVATVSARIIGIQVVSGGTSITVGRGLKSGASNGMKVKIAGVGANATLSNCNDNTCNAIIPATPDQIKGASSVTLSP